MEKLTTPVKRSGSFRQVKKVFVETDRRWRCHYNSLEVPSVAAMTIGKVAGSFAGVSCVIKNVYEAGRSFAQEMGDGHEDYVIDTNLDIQLNRDTRGEI